jgi:pimeloyl-ACP methyl ester carboxylesterase
MREGFVEAAGSRIRMVEEGGGLPLLLIHGNLGSARWYARAMAVPGCRAVALDMPNFGASGPLAGAISIEGYAEAVSAFSAAAGLDRPIVVGHSLGGAVAIAMAARSPSAWRGLVLVDSAPPTGLATPESRHPAIEAMRASRAALEAGLRAVAPALGRGPGARPAEDEAFFQALVDDARLMAAPAWIGNAVALGRMDCSARCSGFRGPVLVLRGAEDLLVTDAMARETASAFPGSRLELLEGVGHSVMAEDPARFVRILSAFAAGLA